MRETGTSVRRAVRRGPSQVPGSAALHRGVNSANSSVRAAREPSTILFAVLAVIALGLTVWGVALVIINNSPQTLAYLAPLIGIFVAVAAGVQQLDQRRAERRKEREQAEQDSVRRFDTRFAAVFEQAAAPDPRRRVGAAAALRSFLRENNHEFHEQTYDFVLSYLKVSAADPVVDHAFMRVFQIAAHLALSGRGEGERRQAVDYCDARLSRVDLCGLELAEADLTRTALSCAVLDGACLWRARGLHKTDLTCASLRHANLEETVFLDGMLAREADFSFANLVAARFAPKGLPGTANLAGARFIGARLQGACLDGAVLTDARFDGANLRGASFHGATLNSAALQSALRSLNRSWRRAVWDRWAWRELKALDSAQGHPTYGSSWRKPSDIPCANYRRHPYPHHSNHPTRPRIAA